MTLPQADKPDTTDQVKDIISDIQENLDYIDSNFNKQAVVDDSYAIASAPSTQTVSGVGFAPSNILIFSSCDTDDTCSFGIYGSSNTYNDLYMGWLYLLGTFQAQLGSERVLSHYTTTGSTGTIKGVISGTHSDGFYIDWTATDSPTGTVNFVALCIR